MARMSRFLISAAIVGIAVAGNFEQEEEEQSGCRECVTTFMAVGGCDDFDNDALVPPGCDYCGEAAWEACGKPGDFGQEEEEEEEEQLGCGECVTKYMAAGGCDDFGNDALIPPGCDLHQTVPHQTPWQPATCEEKFWGACGDMKSAWAECDDMYTDDFGQVEEEEEQLGCGECVFKFMAAGGCDDYDNDALIPPGCDAAAMGIYGEAAWEACGKPGDQLYGFEKVCDGLTSKKCKKQYTCEYKNKQCVKEEYIDMPVDPWDVCVGLKSKKCKKQDMCEYKRKQCVPIEEPIDVCVGLNSKKCKKQDTCEYKKKQCVSIDESIDVCVGLKSKKCKKQDTCEYKRKQKQCVMI